MPLVESEWVLPCSPEPLLINTVATDLVSRMLNCADEVSFPYGMLFTLIAHGHLRSHVHSAPFVCSMA